MAVRLRRRELIGVHPDAHAVVLLAEQENVADAVHARHFVFEMNGGVIAQMKLVEAVIRRNEVDDEQDVGVAFARDDADLLDDLRQLRQGQIDAILHQNLGEIQIDAWLKGDGQAVRAVVGALRRHVEHIFDAVDLLLDGSGHRLGDGLRIGAGIGRGDDDARRRDLRILRNGQRPNGDAARPA